MRKASLFIVAALLPFASAPADTIVTLGDSLTFAYEAEFGFQSTYFGTTYGDGFGPNMRNWVEILSNPAYRGANFELGARRSVQVSFANPPDFYFRQENNWAIPGLRVDAMRRFVLGEAGFKALVGETPAFATFAFAINNSDFTEAADFNYADFENQVTNTADRMTIFVGGNDIREKYGDIYTDDNPGTFNADFIADITAVLDHVQTLNPSLPIVLVAVPHVGITPSVRADFPYDPVKTARVTAVLHDLNGQLATLAEARKIGFADIFTPTLGLIDPVVNLCIKGVTFKNLSSAPVNLNRVWVNGPISANFHPVTNAQAVIANEIIRAFNRRYHTGLAPLTATEMLVNLSGKSAAEADMTFAAWLTCYGLGAATAANDEDDDGISAGVEFATGLNPTFRDADLMHSGITAGNLELAYPTRLPSSPNYALTAESSAMLGADFTPVSPAPALEADGLSHARIPTGGPINFLRLKAVVKP